MSHDQGTLAVHDTADGSVLTQWDVESDVPRHPEAEPENDEVWAAWDWAGGFLDETTLIAGTVESGLKQWLGRLGFSKDGPRVFQRDRRSDRRGGRLIPRR